jgi:hypothetical protein
MLVRENRARLRTESYFETGKKKKDIIENNKLWSTTRCSLMNLQFCPSFFRRKNLDHFFLETPQTSAEIVTYSYKCLVFFFNGRKMSLKQRGRRRILCLIKIQKGWERVWYEMIRGLFFSLTFFSNSFRFIILIGTSTSLARSGGETGKGVF